MNSNDYNVNKSLVKFICSSLNIRDTLPLSRESIVT